MPDELIDVPGVADRLNTTERHVRELIYKRQLPIVKVGRLVRVRVSALEAYLDERTIPAA